jgi:predicted  nucleic acid-binding Zn-ribbon protein
MAFKLSKDELKKRDDLVEELRALESGVETTINAFNEALADAKDAVEEAVTAYNDKLADAREFTQEIAGRIYDEISEKSDKWQEGERGEAATQFKDEWEVLCLDDFECDFPDELASDLPEGADILEGAPEEADMP